MSVYKIVINIVLFVSWFNYLKLDHKNQIY